MMTTLFLSADGKPMSAAQFLENLFGILPDFFKDEDELRSIWSGPDTKRSVFVYRVGHQLLKGKEAYALTELQVQKKTSVDVFF
ncbi:hypothetical protein [Pseudomonas simiae]|jgi:hypothetical protein|uniref:hypothetical protein n=1 Tax=Pseudomonas simiae TaxID=321846 RepID=UPI002732EBDB|nr:hypothetical protein [Pseudomonas simiae]WLI00445.1 hypothetical protein PSH95_24200 [Pseudomonas simiae]